MSGFHREDETAIAIENFSLSGVDQGNTGRCTLAWAGNITAEERAARRGSGFVYVGIDTDRTKAALAAMSQSEADSLIVYHTTVGGVTEVALKQRVHRNTAHNIIARAHVAFWNYRLAHVMAETPRQS
jgi:hypothetical protein